MPMKPKTVEVLFVADLARVLRTSPKTIMRGVKAGTFPIQPLARVDNKLRWSSVDVDEFLGMSSEDVDDRKRMLKAIRAMDSAHQGGTPCR